MSLSGNCSCLHLAVGGAGFAVLGLGGGVLADCRTASLICRTVQSTLTPLKHRADSRLIISKSLSGIRHMIADSRLAPRLARYCPIRSVTPRRRGGRPRLRH